MKRDFDLQVVILAGGFGSRFWPLSQPSKPKQFLSIAPITGKKTLLDATVERIAPLVDLKNISIIGLAEHFELFKATMPDFTKMQFYLEPFGRNTAACVAVVTRYLLDKDPNTAQLWLPADHVIANPEVLHHAVEFGLERMRQSDSLFTFGVVPRRPETGYGYIEVGEQKDQNSSFKISAATRFHEKPDLNTAEKYLAEGKFLWNSGMFLWKTEVIARELERQLPALWSLAKKLPNIKDNHKPVFLDKTIYEKMEKVSIDYGVMENAKSVEVIETPLIWSDLGGWTSVFEMMEKDENNNAVFSKVEKAADATGNLVFAPDCKIILNGVNDLAIVSINGNILISSLEKVSQIRELVDELKEQ